MKTIAFCLFFSIVIIGNTFSQNKIWDAGTATTLSRGDLRAGVFLPWAYGVTETFELILEVPLNIVCPNLMIKKQWYSEKWLIASRHGIAYPSLGLNLFSGNIDKYYDYPEDKTPAMIGMKNELLISRGFSDNKCNKFSYNSKVINEKSEFIITGKLGVAFGTFLKEGESTDFQHPALYKYLEVFQGNSAIYSGIDLDGKWFENLHFSIDADLIYLDNRFYLDHKALLIYYFSESWGVLAGYKYFSDPMNFSDLPIYPMVDLVFHFYSKRKIQHGLYKTRPF